jgi:thymidylate synthase (FAD)
MRSNWSYYSPNAYLVVQPAPSDQFKEHFSSTLELIAFCARVSNPANQFNNETGEKLIRYLIKHKHWSPLEMCSATIGIDTTRDIARQILRHRSFVFQEFSQRYADPADLEVSFVLREARMQDPKNRQNSTYLDDEDLQKSWAMKQTQIIHEANLAYKWAILNGIAKEQARCVLPEGNTVSKIYMNGTIRSWIHYIELRSSNGTQQEHIEVARMVATAIAKIFPMASEFVSYKPDSEY